MAVSSKTEWDKWAALAGLLLFLSAFKYGLSGLIALVKDEFDLRLEKDDVHLRKVTPRRA